MNMKKILIGLLSLLMVVSLILGIVGPVLALEIEDVTGDGKVEYLAIGAQNAIGTGLSDTNNAYPALVGNHLGVSHQVIGTAGMRMEELQFLLVEGYESNDYTAWLGMDIAALKNAYQTAVAAADVITLDLGANSFGTFVLEQLASGGTKFNADLSSVMSADDAATFEMYKSMLTAMVRTEWELDENVNLDLIVDTLAFAYASYCRSLDSAVSAIYAINPDVTLVVVGMEVPVSDVQIDSVGLDASVSSLFAGAVDLANLYAATQGSYCDRYFFAYTGEHGADYVTEPVTVTGVSGNCNYLSEQGHVSVKDAIAASLDSGIRGGYYYDPMMAKLVGDVTGSDAKTPTEAMSGEFAGGKNALYVSIGDASAVANGEAVTESFADILADKLRIGNMTNLAQNGLLSSDCAAILTENEELLADADLVTMSFGVNSFTDLVAGNLKNIITGRGEYTEVQWDLYLSAEAEAEIQAMLDDLRNDLIDQGFNATYPGKSITYADIMVMAIEQYLFQTVAHIQSYPALIEQIHAANPDALVVLVGMSNPMEGLTLVYNDASIPLGEYVNFVAEISNAHYLITAMATENVVYVEAPDVQTAREAEADVKGEEVTNELQLLPFLTQLISKNTEKYQPSADGHSYVATQIHNSLVARLMGDVNRDGRVNNVDAMLILQYYVRMIDADKLDLELANVNGDKTVNNVDAMLILQYYVQMIEHFPVEK